jgi:hypothetical protein
VQDIRSITSKIAAEVIKKAASEGMDIASGAAAAMAKGDCALVTWISRRMFVPTYNSLAYLPPGIGE